MDATRVLNVKENLLSVLTDQELHDTLIETKKIVEDHGLNYGGGIELFYDRLERKFKVCLMGAIAYALGHTEKDDCNNQATWDADEIEIRRGTEKEVDPKVIEINDYLMPIINEYDPNFTKEYAWQWNDSWHYNPSGRVRIDKEDVLNVLQTAIERSADAI